MKRITLTTKILILIQFTSINKNDDISVPTVLNISASRQTIYESVSHVHVYALLDNKLGNKLLNVGF